MTVPSGNRVVLNQETLIPAGIAVALIIALVGVVVWATTVANNVAAADRRLLAVEDRSEKDTTRITVLEGQFTQILSTLKTIQTDVRDLRKPGVQ